MNKEEYSRSHQVDKYKFYRYVQKLLKEWKVENSITERYVVHHRDDNEEVRAYNNEHYERWGFNEDCTFELGKYVQFMTGVEHSRYHNTGEKNPHYGKPLSAEHRNKISNAMKNGSSPWYGKQLSVEHKKNLSLSHMGKTLTEEQRKKISASNKGRVVSEETREKLRIAGKNRAPEIIEKLRIANTGPNNHMWGKTTPDDVKEKLRISVKLAKEKTVALYNKYKQNNGELSWNDFQRALKNNEINIE